MNDFLKDCFDVQHLADVKIDVRDVLTDKNELSYNKLYKSTRVLLCLKIWKTWFDIFAVHPSRADICKLYNGVSEALNTTCPITTIVDHIKRNTILQSIPELYENTIRLVLQTPLSIRIDDVKTMLRDKLTNRYHYNSSYEPGISLFALYTKIRCQRVATSESNVNPLTRYELLPKDRHTIEHPCIEDRLRYVYTHDWYLLRMTLLKHVIVVDMSNEKSVNIGDVTAILESRTSEQCLFVCGSNSCPQQWRKIADLTICINIPVATLFACLPVKLKSLVLIGGGHIPSAYKLSTDTYHVVDNQVMYKSPQDELTIPYIHSINLLEAIEKVCVSTTNSYVLRSRSVLCSAMQLLEHSTLDRSALCAKSCDQNVKNCILLVDNRENAMSIVSIFVTLSKLRNREWRLVIVTSAKAQLYYKNILGVHAHIVVSEVLDKKRFDMEDYNAILKSVWLWDTLKNFQFDNCLVVQDDGFIVREGLEDMFLNKYDYVGSPWAPIDANKDLFTVANKWLVGNGGLSLRNVKMMHDIASQPESVANHLFNHNAQIIPEDVYFSHEVAKRGGRIPTSEEASRFGSEQVLNLQSLGVHKFWGYHDIDSVKKYFNALTNVNQKL